MVLLYVVFVVGLGFYFARRTATTEDYFLAGRSLVWWLIGFSLFASNVSSTTLMGLSSAAFGSGSALSSDASPASRAAPEVTMLAHQIHGGNGVIEENDLARRIRYRHEITSSSWSSEERLWTLEGRRTDTDEDVRFTCNFLWMCQGYYRHAEGHTPEWEGMDDFEGEIVHPQTWPEDLDYKGKRVVVIGSGATAMTLVPAMADDDDTLAVLKEIREIQKKQLDQQARFLWVLLPIFAALAMILILGMTGFFAE